MKTITLLTLLFCSTITIGQTRMSNDQISTDESGVKFHDSKPFTGVVYLNHKNGNVWKEAAYVDGKLQGVSKGFYESGQIWFEQEISNGQYIYIKKWHDNGQLKSEQYYKKARVSSYKEWDQDGNLVKEE
jgi:antitoxin component YwqK of YwqJK toxin-antitoxin module